MLKSLQEKLSLFDSWGQVENHLCLVINKYAQSLTDWYEKLSDLGFEVVGEHNVEETVEAIAFKQMISWEGEVNVVCYVFRMPFSHCC